MLPLSQGRGSHSLTATASPKGKKMEGWRGLLPPWDGRKVEFSSPDTRLWPAVPRLLRTLRRDPWGSAASRALHRHRGGPNLKNAPALSGQRFCTHSQRRPAQRERKWRGGGGSCPHGMEEKLSSPPPALGSGLPCPSTLYTP